MKKNIFDKLSQFYNKRKKEKIPQDFQLDLNESDFYKYNKVYPKHSSSITILLIHSFFQLIIYGFILYAIADFMNYEMIMNLILMFQDLFGTLIGQFSMQLFMLLVIIDIVNMMLVSIDRNRIRRIFYNKLKKYKK